MTNPNKTSKPKSKKKSSVKTAIVYFATMISFILILGIIVYFIVSRYVFPANASSKSESHEKASDFIPEESDASTILYALKDEDTVSLLMLVRIDPLQREIRCVPVPVNTISKINTKEYTLNKFYEKSGARVLCNAVENAYGISINRYAILSRHAFNRIVEDCGGISFPLPFDMVYKNENNGEITDFKSTDTKRVFWGDDLRKIMTYPLSANGQEYNINISGGIVCTLINESVKSKERIIGGLDDMYADVISFSECNITEYDFKIAKQCLEYIMNGNDRPASYSIPTGSWNKDGTFSVDKSYKNELSQFFYL